MNLGLIVAVGIAVPLLTAAIVVLIHLMGGPQ